MRDKLLHFAAGAIIAFPATLAVGEVWGIAIAVFAGVAKEIRDELAYGGADLGDLLATVAGGLVGMAVA